MTCNVGEGFLSVWLPLCSVQALHGTVDAKVLTTVNPAEIDPEFFREMAAVINAAAGGPPDRTKMVQIMQKYGLTPVLPPST